MSLATTQSVAEIKARNKQLIDEVLKVYPEKTAKRRAKHLNVHEAGKSDCGVKSNLKSIPGVMTFAAAPMPAPRAWCGVRSRT